MRAGAAQADLRLPAITVQAARRLRNRRNYVAVQDAADKIEPGPSTVMEYVGRVANILTHTTYYFPQCGLQVASYVAWLISRSAGRSLQDVQTADSSATAGHGTAPTGLPDLAGSRPVPAGCAADCTAAGRWHTANTAPPTGLLSAHTAERVHHAMPDGSSAPAVQKMHLGATRIRLSHRRTACRPRRTSRRRTGAARARPTLVSGWQPIGPAEQQGRSTQVFVLRDWNNYY